MEKTGTLLSFPQRIAVSVPKKLATSMAQSVIGNGLTGVVQMDDTIELVAPRMVQSCQVIPENSHVSTSA